MSGAYRDLEDVPSENFLAATQTVLAWRRTALQVAVGAVLAARLLSEAFGPWVFVAALGGVGLAVAVHASASAAYAEGTKARGGHVSRSGKARIADAKVRLTMLAAFTAAVALAGLLWILIQL
ncbi:hypothetical protein [Demequina sp. NBRC 110053]|uniref:hypothetical protein n=1 Tax=Demequina sp. NBRC 110053 TaxID=1570342 RepID=UPI000A012118|nr:hypothetical protein [Demequina sp. NBRC 110053]